MSQTQPGGAPTAPYPYPYAYPAYPAGAPTPPTLPPTPAQRDPSRGTKLAGILVLVALAIAGTVGSLALAYLAPSLGPQAPAPSTVGLARVFDGSLANGPDAVNWDVTGGCQFTTAGLDAGAQSSPALCTFVPSQNADLVSRGFELTATVGPAADVAGQQQACIVLQSQSVTYSLAIGQAGDYDLAANPATICEVRAGLGESDAWHADGYTANRVTLRYDATAQTLAVYFNGQQVAVQQAALTDAHWIELGASAGDEAVFTSFALYSASA